MDTVTLLLHSSRSGQWRLTHSTSTQRRLCGSERCGGLCAQGDTDHTVHPLKFTQDEDCAAGAAAKGCPVLGQGPGLHLA